METTYTARQVAAALGVAKSTVLRSLDKLPPEMTAQGAYRGQPTKLVTTAGIQRLAMLLSVSEINYAALNESHPSAPSAAFSESSEAKQGEAERADLIAELRARIAAQDKELTAKNDQIAALSSALEAAQEATKTAQALHAATAEQLRLLTARTPQEAPEPPQDAEQPERATDTTPSAESAQEPPSAPTEAPTPANTRRATFADRLRFLFRGEM